MTLLVLLVVLLTHVVLPCAIHGTNNGVCKSYLPSSQSLDDIERAREVWERDMPFCGSYIANNYIPCVPSDPTGSWLLATGKEMAEEGSVRAKDRWAEETFSMIIAGDQFRINNTRDCKESLAKYFCWLNFPRCHDEHDVALPMCQSACENLFRNCQIDNELWRCQVGVVDGQEDEYSRFGFFPGEPFAKNEFVDGKREPAAVCTPSIKGGATGMVGTGISVFVSSCLFLAML